MDSKTVVALAVAVPIALLGLISGYFQLRGRRLLRERKHVPSDEFAYLQSRHRRRLFAAGVMVLISCLMAGSYLFGIEQRADALAENKRADAPLADGEQRVIPEEERTFAKIYGAYWGVVLLLTCLLLMIAVSDAWATRRYWFTVYREMRNEHNAKLRRDLAVYRQQVEQQRSTGRSGYGGRLGDGNPPSSSN